MGQMNRFFRVLAVSIGMLFSVSSPAYAQQAVYPIGLKAQDVVTGIYAGDNLGNCCWVGTHAEIKTVVPAGADTLLLNVYLPRFAVKGGVQSLHMQIGGARPVLRCCLGAGEHEIAVALPLAARHGSITIRLWPDRTFVPNRVGVNGDSRHLSMMLREVGFLNAVTGERLDNPKLPWTPARTGIPILLCCGVAILLLTLRRPLYGLLALIATDPFLFAYAIHGTTVTLPKIALIAVALGLAPRVMQIVRRRPLRTLLALAGVQLLFAATMLPGFAHALFHGAALRETLKAFEYLMTIVVAYCAYRLDPSEMALRVVLALSTIVVTALAFAQLAFPANESEAILGHSFTRIAGPLEGPNQLAGFLGVVVPAMLAFVVLRRPLVLEWVGIAMGTVACLLTFSRGGTAALLLASVVILAVRYFPARRALVGASLTALFCVLLALAFGVFSGALHGKIQSLFGQSGAFNVGLGSRVDLWHAAYAFWRSHPLFGIGAGNFELEVGRYIPVARTHANGIYFQVLAEQGLAGLIAVLALTAATVGAFIRRLDEPLALGACVVGMAMAFHQIVDCIWLYPKVGVMWWIVLAMGAAVVDLRAENHSEACVEPSASVR